MIILRIIELIVSLVALAAACLGLMGVFVDASVNK